MVCNRWNLEFEYQFVVNLVNVEKVDHKLYGELLFISHADKSILVWNLMTRQSILHLPGNEVPAGLIYPTLCVDHNLLIAFFTSISPYENGENEEWNSCVTIRRIDPAMVF